MYGVVKGPSCFHLFEVRAEWSQEVWRGRACCSAAISWGQVSVWLASKRQLQVPLAAGESWEDKNEHSGARTDSGEEANKNKGHTQVSSSVALWEGPEWPPDDKQDCCQGKLTDDIRRGTLSNDDAGNIMCGFAVRVPSQIGLKRGTQIAGQNSIYMDLRTEK